MTLPARRAIPFLAPVSIAALWLLFWWHAIVDGQRLIARDLHLFALPMKHYLRERVLAGEMPLWNPYVGAGMPYLADPANQTLYSLNAVVLAAPSAGAGLNWFLLAHALLAPLAAFVLARVLGARRAAATWGGLLYGFGGYTLSMLENVNYVVGTVWVPLLVAALVAAVVRRSPPALALGALCLAQLALGGAAIDAVVGLAAAAIVAAPSARPVRAALTRAALYTGVCACVAALIAAVQIVPTLEMSVLSQRVAGLSLVERGTWSFPPSRLVELVHPYPFGSHYSGEWLRPALYPQRSLPWADSVYIGLIPMLAAAWALRFRARDALPWLAVAALALVLALGQHLPLYSLLADLPFVSTQRYPEKLMLYVTLGACMLAALGASDALDRTSIARAETPAPSPRRRNVAWVVVAGVIAFVLLAYVPARFGYWDQAVTPSRYWSARLPGSHTLLSGLFVHALAVGAVIVLALVLARRHRRSAIVLLGAFAIADLAWVHLRQVPVVPAAVLGGEPPAPLAVLREPGRVFSDVRLGAPATLVHPGALATRVARWPQASEEASAVWLLRVLHARETLERNFGLLYGLSYLNGEFSPLEPAAHDRFVHVLGPEHGHLMMSLAGVRYVLTPIQPHALAWDGPGFEERWREPGLNLRVLEVRDPVPLVYAARALASDAARQPGELPGLLGKTRQSVVVEQPAHAGAPGEARLVSDTPESKSVSVVAPGEGTWLVIDESFYPGWSATLDSGSAPVVPANGYFMAVPVPAGEHLVELRFEPSWWLTAVSLSTIGLLVTVVLLLSPLREKMRNVLVFVFRSG